MKMIADIGYALCIEQNVAANGYSYECHYKSVHRNELLEYLTYRAFQEIIGNRKRDIRNKYNTMLGYDISSCVLYRKPKSDNNAFMDRLYDGEPSIAGSVEGSPDPQCNEENDVNEYMGLNNILNEDMDMIIDNLYLNNIGETVETTLRGLNGHVIG